MVGAAGSALRSRGKSGEQIHTMTYGIYIMLEARDVIASILIKKTLTGGGWAVRGSKQRSYSSATAAWSRKEPQGRMRSWQLEQIV